MALVDSLVTGKDGRGMSSLVGKPSGRPISSLIRRKGQTATVDTASTVQSIVSSPVVTFFILQPNVTPHPSHIMCTLQKDSLRCPCIHLSQCRIIHKKCRMARKADMRCMALMADIEYNNLHLLACIIGNPQNRKVDNVSTTFALTDVDKLDGASLFCSYDLRSDRASSHSPPTLNPQSILQ
jgi:hypothetical protein